MFKYTIIRAVFLGVMCVGGSFLYGALDQDSVSGVVPQEVVIDGILHSAFGAIPAEIKNKIFSGLGKRDIKNVKKTCKDFNGSAKYRWNEVRGYIDFPEGYTVEQVAPRLFRCLARTGNKNGIGTCNEESDSIGGFVCHCLISGCKNFKKNEGSQLLFDHLKNTTNHSHSYGQHYSLLAVAGLDKNFIDRGEIVRHRDRLHHMTQDMTQDMTEDEKNLKEYIAQQAQCPLSSKMINIVFTPEQRILLIALLEQELKKVMKLYFEKLEHLEDVKAHVKVFKANIEVFRARMQAEQEAEAREEQEELNKARRIKLEDMLREDEVGVCHDFVCDDLRVVEDILREDEVGIDHDFVCDDLPVDGQAEKFVASVLGDEELIEWYVEDDAQETKCVTACGQHKRTADSSLSELDRLQGCMRQAEEWALESAPKRPCLDK